MGNHQGSQVVFRHQLGRQGQHLQGGFGVQSGGVLIQQQEFGLGHGGHQQGQRLALAARQQAHFGGQAIFQAQVQGLEQITVFLPLLFGDAHPQGTGFAAAGSQGQVFLDLHGGGGAGHGVLEHPANVLGPLMFTQAGHIGAVDHDFAGIHRPDTSHRVQHGGLACAVAADDGDEVALVQMEGEMVQGRLFVDGACVKGLGNVLDIKHGFRPPSEPFWGRAWRSTSPSSTGLPGRWQPQRPTAA